MVSKEMWQKNHVRVEVWPIKVFRRAYDEDEHDTHHNANERQVACRLCIYLGEFQFAWPNIIFLNLSSLSTRNTRSFCSPYMTHVIFWNILIRSIYGSGIVTTYVWAASDNMSILFSLFYPSGATFPPFGTTTIEG